MLRAGLLRERVTIQVSTETENASGGGTIAWSDVATVWAQVVPVRGDEQLQAQRLDSVVLYAITIRFRSDVSAANRLLWNGKPLNIRAVFDPDGRREALKITAEMGVA